MEKNETVTTDMVLSKIEEVKGMLAKLREQICAEDGAGDEFTKHAPQESDLQKIEKEYAKAADAVRKHNAAGTQESSEGAAATQELLKVASLRNRARKEAEQGIR